MHCSTQRLYSITSSARANSVGDTVNPSGIGVSNFIQTRVGPFR
jgi:hypothetical protein